MTKTCTKCKLEQPLTEFYRDGRRGGNATLHRCKTCMNSTTRANRETDPEMYREKTRAAVAKRRAKLGTRYLRYGLTRDQLFNMLDAQDWECPICFVELTWETFNVDHDHECCPGGRACSKCTRGLLCWGCNTGLGKMGDSADRLRRAAEYLDKHEL